MKKGKKILHPEMTHKREPWAEGKVMHKWVEYLNSLVMEIHHYHEFERFG